VIRSRHYMCLRGCYKYMRMDLILFDCANCDDLCFFRSLCTARISWRWKGFQKVVMMLYKYMRMDSSCLTMQIAMTHFSLEVCVL
jgi:hypothetical protein